MNAKLPPLPPLPPRERISKSDADKALNTPNTDLLELRRACLDSAIGRPDADGHVYAICANCGESTPWWQSVWGKWNSGHTAMIMVPPRPGSNRWKRFAVAVYVSGRTCTDCTMELPEWRRIAEPSVTVDMREILSTGAATAAGTVQEDAAEKAGDGAGEETEPPTRGPK